MPRGSLSLTHFCAKFLTQVDNAPAQISRFTPKTEIRPLGDISHRNNPLRGKEEPQPAVAQPRGRHCPHGESCSHTAVSPPATGRGGCGVGGGPATGFGVGGGTGCSLGSGIPPDHGAGRGGLGGSGLGCGAGRSGSGMGTRHWLDGCADRGAGSEGPGDGGVGSHKPEQNFGSRKELVVETTGKNPPGVKSLCQL